MDGVKDTYLFHLVYCLQLPFEDIDLLTEYSIHIVTYKPPSISGGGMCHHQSFAVNSLWQTPIVHPHGNRVELFPSHKAHEDKFYNDSTIGFLRLSQAGMTAAIMLTMRQTARAMRKMKGENSISPSMVGSGMMVRWLLTAKNTHERNT